MAKMVRITGFTGIMRNLKKSQLATASGVSRGLKKGGLFLQRQSQKIVPIDTAILKNTANTRNVGGAGFKTDVVVSYGTEYAVYVHENLNSQHKEGKEAKYLETPARVYRLPILKIIETEAVI